MTSPSPRNGAGARHGQATPTDAITEVAIVIPARNEQARLARCLDAIVASIADLQRTEFASVGVACPCRAPAPLRGEGEVMGGCLL